jgi:hypothetical protein
MIAPSAVEVVQTQIITSPDPMRKAAPMSGDFARSNEMEATKAITKIKEDFEGAKPF